MANCAYCAEPEVAIYMAHVHGEYLGSNPFVQITSPAARQIQQRVRTSREPAPFVARVVPCGAQCDDFTTAEGVGR